MVKNINLLRCMSIFTKFTSIHPIPWKNVWVTSNELVFYENDDMTWDKIVVPCWFEFDWASTPRFIRILFPPAEPRTINAACLHDWLFANKSYSLRKTDLLFLRALKASGFHPIKRWTMFLGLKLWSRLPWLFTWQHAKYKIFKH